VVENGSFNYWVDVLIFELSSGEDGIGEKATCEVGCPC
jgi:hypothetical protein